MRDSAGVRIVESAEPAWSPGVGWRLAPAPSVDIGAIEGDPQYELFQVQSAVRLTDGRIAITHAGQEIHVYERDGAYESTWGRKGAGPGEFEGLSQLHLMADDSVLALDARLRRLSVFDANGQFARSISLGETPEGQAMQFVAPFADGSLLVRGWSLPVGEPPTGYLRDTVPLFRYTATGEYDSRLGDHEGDERFIVQQARGDTRLVFLGQPIFGHRGFWATIAALRYLVAQSDRYEYRLYGSSGALEGVVRRLVDPVPVTDALVETVLELRVAPIEDDNARREQLSFLRDLPVSETLPAFGRHGWTGPSSRFPTVIVDEDQNVWIHEYVLPDEPEVRWSVFDSAGVWLGVVEVPERFEPMHIGSDFVLGRWVDDLEVEHVRMHELLKPDHS